MTLQNKVLLETRSNFDHKTLCFLNHEVNSVLQGVTQQSLYKSLTENSEEGSNLVGELVSSLVLNMHTLQVVTENFNSGSSVD